MIHLPGRDLGENGDEPAEGETAVAKRPTRRGSRGGRNRKRKPATVAAEEAGAPEEGAEAIAAAGGSGEWEYTPMSEWEDS